MPGRARYLESLERDVLGTLKILSFDVEVARVYGQICALLEADGRTLPDPDLQIAATAIQHDLELVTGNLKHFGRVPGLRICPVLADARSRRG